MLKARDLVRILKSQGFYQTRQRGSHAIFSHKDGRVTSIPMHGGEDIGRGLLSEILDQVKISRENFRRLL